MVHFKLSYLFLILCTISLKESIVNGKYLQVIYAGLYERDFYREFTSQMQNNSTSDELTNILDVLNRTNLLIEDIPKALDPRSCLICRASVYTVLSHYNQSSADSLGILLKNLCVLLTSASENVCRGNVNVYLPTIEYILKEKADKVLAEEVCGILIQPANCATNDSLIEFTINTDDPILKNAKEHKFDDTLSNLTIVHLTDFHYDPYYAEGSSSDCTDDICCRNTSQAINDSKAKAGKWGDYKVCDSPGYLIENICEQVSGQHKKIDFVYYTGDFVDHFSWNTSREYVKQSIEFVTNTFKNYFADVPVVPVIGNHDVHPSNSFAPSSVTDETVGSQWLYNFLADQWQIWLPESALETLRKGGYYTFSIRTGLRIIVLNSNICYTGNLWLLYESHSLQEQLQWLHDTLLAAEIDNEKVHILSHVPANTDSCVKAWDREYRRIVVRFAHIIAGQFNGHTHFDEFCINYAPGTSDALNIAFNGGSGTAFVELNSNYRIYYADSKNFEIIDHETWIFNLTEANLKPDVPPNWFKEYSFKDLYGVNDVSPSTIHKMLTEDWMNDNSKFIKYWHHKNKQSDVVHSKQCDDKCVHNLWCGIVICPS